MIKKYFVSICTYKYTHRYMCLQMDIHYKYIHTYRYTYLQMAKYIYIELNNMSGGKHGKRR